MPSTKRCVFGCETTGVTIHSFPSPEKFPERFQKWVGIAGAAVDGMSDEHIYKNKKVCDKHFTRKDKNRNHRLNALAVPCLHLPYESTSPNHNMAPNLPQRADPIPDSTSNDATSRHTFNICCCCLKEQDVKEISSEYYVSGQNEMYVNMLKDTFGIQILTHNIDDNITHICENCIDKLKEATAFKQLALASLKNFYDYAISLQSKDSIMKDDLNGEATSFENFIILEISNDEDSSDNNEVLADIQFESPCTKDAILDSNTQETLLQNNKTKRKGTKSEYLEHIQKDWSKIKERRGNGPLLRDASLTLLANSNLCVFQYDRSSYRCFCCKQPFVDIPSLKTHTNTHTLGEINKKIIAQQNRLVKVEITDLKCRLCERSLENLKELRQHLTEKHNITMHPEDLLVPFKINNILSCQLCEENFDAFRHLNIHMNKHFLKHICHVCGAGFSNLVFLNLHKARLHKPLKCTVCKTEFNNKSDLKTHEISHGTKREIKKRFPCQFCGVRFSQEQYRVLHLVEKHGMKRPEFKCLVCLKSFVTKSLRNNHIKGVHMKQRTEECDVCHRMFYSKSDVKRHRVTHSGERRFSCGICSSMFASKDSLRRHVKRGHSGM